LTGQARGMGNTALSASSSSTSSTLTRTVRQTQRSGGSDYSGPRSTERSSSNSVGRDNQHRANPIQPWVDIQLPEPEKYRDFQSGPVPHVVSSSMVRGRPHKFLKSPLAEVSEIAFALV